MPEFDVDAWLDTYKPRTDEVRVGVDPDLVAEHTRLDGELRAAMLSRDEDRSIDLAGQVAALEERLAASGQVFRLQAVTSAVWDDLLRDHPPTGEQLAKNRHLDHDPETFPVAAIAATVTDPKLTEVQVRRARDTLSNADFVTLRDAVYMVNREVMTVPKSLLAGAALPTSGGSSATPAPKGSRGRPSKAANAARSRSTSTRKAT